MEIQTQMATTVNAVVSLNALCIIMFVFGFTCGSLLVYIWTDLLKRGS